MALLAKIGIPALVILGLITGTWYMKHEGTKTKTEDTVTQDQGNLEQNTTATKPATEADSISARDNSDQSLTSDTASIDAQLKIMDSSNSAVDQADKPVAQDSI